MSDADRPALSVVIAVREIPEALGDVLDALESQEGFHDAEVLLADGTADGLETTLGLRYPWLRFVRPAGRTLPGLKGAAIQAARSDLVAVLDPYDVPDPGWIVAARRALGPSGPVAAGGVVLADGPGTAGNRAAYLFEYGAFNPPVREGPTDGDLPGNNVVYRRKALVEDHADVLAAEGFNKPFFHQRFREAGERLEIHTDMRVRHRTRHRFLPFAVRRFHYGRCFGAIRRRRARGMRRFVLAVFAPVAPPLLVFRHLTRAFRHPGNRKLLPSAAVALVGVCLFWGVGEWLGAWLGPGRSCERFY